MLTRDARAAYLRTRIQARAEGEEAARAADGLAAARPGEAFRFGISYAIVIARPATDPDMRVRTLVTERLYFGFDALSLRAATARVQARVVGLPPERARVSTRNLCQDFGIDATRGQALIEALVAKRLLVASDGPQADYGLTERFAEFAAARVVEPLPRERARQLLAQACELAAQVNDEWTHHPLEIEAVAPFGNFMTRDNHLAELSLGVVVRPRAVERRARWGRMKAKSDTAHEIRARFRELSSYIHVRLVHEMRLLPRPFAVAFKADAPSLLVGT